MTKGPTVFSCTVAQLTGQLKACLDSWLRNTQLVGSGWLSNTAGKRATSEQLPKNTAGDQLVDTS